MCYKINFSDEDIKDILITHGYKDKYLGGTLTLSS